MVKDGRGSGMDSQSKLQAHLRDAIKRKDRRRVAKLVKAGADPMGRDGAGATALTLAVRRRSEACFDELLPMSDCDAVDECGLSALDWAVELGEACFVEKLVGRARLDAMPTPELEAREPWAKGRPLFERLALRRQRIVDAGKVHPDARLDQAMGILSAWAERAAIQNTVACAERAGAPRTPGRPRGL
jgi:hypothetical protein